MQLRDHPLLIRKSGYASWPPHWTTTLEESNEKPHGEIGILQDVLMHPLFNNKIFMFVDQKGIRYMGLLAFDDRAFCSQLFKILELQIGRSIKEIADLDLAYIL